MTQYMTHVLDGKSRKMFPELNALADFSDTSPPKSKFILISDYKNDGCFLIHHFLSMYIRGGFQVVFLALTQSLAHYSSVAQKLGVNLNNALEKNQLKYLDGLNLVSEALSDGQCCKSPNLTEEIEKDSNPFHSIRAQSFTLQRLYRRVKSHIDGVNKPCLLLIDDLSVLLSLGIPVQDISDFMQYCASLMCDSSKVVDGCLVCLVHDDSDADDDDSVLLWKQLSHGAHMEFHVEGLSSGHSKDVHGQLTITWRAHDEPMSPQGYTKKVTQYKVQDKNVKFFAPGTSRAVL